MTFESGHVIVHYKVPSSSRTIIHNGHNVYTIGSFAGWIVCSTGEWDMHANLLDKRIEREVTNIHHIAV